MKSFQFKKIDAFTKGTSSGNPAGCLYLDQITDITDAEMQQIAKELKGYVNEVVYLFPEKNTYLLKYYSSECEVDFCGHGTIAIMYDFLSSHPELLTKEEVYIRVKDQTLLVKNQIQQDDSVYITAPEPQFHQLNIPVAEICAALQIQNQEINSQYRIDLINGGLNTLIVPIEQLKNCLALNPDQRVLRDFCLKNNIDIVLVFSTETAKNSNNYRTRVFAPKFGYLEDPATGSGNSAFGYYLLKEQLWDGYRLVIEQGPNYDHPNIINLKTTSLNNKTRILFGGSAIVKISGEYNLYD